MLTGDTKRKDYEPLKPAKRKDSNSLEDVSSLVSPKNSVQKKPIENEVQPKLSAETEKNESNSVADVKSEEPKFIELPYAARKKQQKKQKAVKKDLNLLQSDRWIVRNGHTLTYYGVFLFSFFVFFRPYELIPGLGFLISGAFIIAVATLLIYVPTQFTTEGNLTILTTEVKCVLAMTFLALILMPISRDFAAAWETFNDPFIKAVIIFIVMINVVRTRKRLLALMWISFSISIYMSYTAISMYQRGEFKTEGYRVSLDIKGMFENANEMALHLVTMIPLLITLGLASKSRLGKVVYFTMTALLFAANVVTFSRGGFLGLIASMAVLVWKIGRNNRVRTIAISLVVGLIFIIAAPGNYGVRLLSIFIPGLDPVGSSDLRKENLILSILVTIRNPWGIGIGNSPTFGVHNLETHNAFTQVSSELGLLGLAAYLIMMISPFRKLGAIERMQHEKGEYDWFYYMSIGFQASIVAYMVSSFFASIAYLWFIYYLVGYAVALRRIYMIEKGFKEDIQANPLWQTSNA
ncbi:MAG: hypothetical protein LUM44_15685 [Pyrinomonadaceae bacterium]|nr:hypothetical protein [Pyrinomonadaceae bacterium]